MKNRRRVAFVDRISRKVSPRDDVFLNVCIVGWKLSKRKILHSVVSIFNGGCHSVVQIWSATLLILDCSARCLQKTSTRSVSTLRCFKGGKNCSQQWKNDTKRVLRGVSRSPILPRNSWLVVNRKQNSLHERNVNVKLRNRFRYLFRGSVKITTSVNLYKIWHTYKAEVSLYPRLPPPALRLQFLFFSRFKKKKNILLRWNYTVLLYASFSLYLYSCEIQNLILFDRWSWKD